jgi:hypothetical protein
MAERGTMTTGSGQEQPITRDMLLVMRISLNPDISLESGTRGRPHGL